VGRHRGGGSLEGRGLIGGDLPSGSAAPSENDEDQANNGADRHNGICGCLDDVRPREAGAVPGTSASQSRAWKILFRQDTTGGLCFASDGLQMREAIVFAHPTGCKEVDEG
jgi:hypothetical protein